MKKPLNMFISYSHKDESYVDDLKKHLITLKRRNILDEWHDRELIVGDTFDSEIKDKLANADLVAFLVSVDFINSWYCYNVELQDTLQRLTNNTVRIIPIIIRHCKWQDTELSEYLAATKDGKPISKYTDPDAAWVEVIDSIENAAKKYNNLQKEHGSKIPTTINAPLTLKEKFKSKLEDTEVVFNHKYKEQITLEDIFVFPDLKNIMQEYDEIGETINSAKVADSKKSKTLVMGGEQSGKTSLSKMLFKQYLEKNCIPLLCHGSQISNTDFEKLQRKLIKEQYSELTWEDFCQLKHQSVVIIDDYHELKINVRHQRKLIEIISQNVGSIIVLSNTSMKYDESRFIELSDFTQFEILAFGNLRRGELIEKWNSIGRVETIDIKELHDENDSITTHINSIIRKNVLPPKPIYILTIIQLIDTSKPSDYSLTSYGHCYQSLIQENFNKANIKSNDFDLYINYLTELAYHLYDKSKDKINDSELKIFQETYSKQYLIQSHKKVMDGLLASGIIRKKEGCILFGYRYIYYFYVAKYLADNLDTNNCKKSIEHLCENIHTEENANILIFLVHHSKDIAIIDEILLHASLIFDGTQKATLDKGDTQYLLDYISTIPSLVIEQKDIEEERKSHLKIKDTIEKFESGIENDLKNNEEDDNKVLSEINKSSRMIEIIGQILRNRSGSLKREQLKELILSAYESGLKFLNLFLTTTREEQEYILNFLQNIFIDNSGQSDDKVIKEARSIFLMLCYGTSYSVIKKIATSLGSHKLIPIFDEINTEQKTSPAMRLIHVAIQLEFDKSIPKNELIEIYKECEDNPIAQRLLQELLVQHLYLNHVDYRDRQWISSKMHLPLKTQKLLENKDEYKK